MYVYVQYHDSLLVFIGLKTQERSDIQAEWMSGHVPVIVATISFGMGVDKANVRLITIRSAI